MPFGIHRTLTRDSVDHRWTPMAPADQVPSLLDQDGQFFTTATIPQLLAQARMEDIERELRAQIDAVTGSGLAPTHLLHLDVPEARHHDVLMRTTLTLDDDVLALVQESMHRERRTMKAVVNDALRHSLAAHPSARAYSVTPHDAQLQPGIDPGRLNHLADELEDDAIVAGWRV